MLFALWAAWQWIKTAYGVVRDSWVGSTLVWLWEHAKSLGRLVGRFGRRAWKVLRATWDHVLVPAWHKVDKFVTDLHGWLERHFAPLLLKLNAVRKRLGDFWRHYVSPILTLLDVTRGFLGILARLGVDWAKKLDAEIARLETLIAKPFLEIFRRLNEVGDWINWIIDEGGLFQRVVLLKSLLAQAHDAWDVLVGAKSKPITASERDALKLAVKGKKLPDVQADLALYLRTGGGDLAATVNGAAAAWRGYLGVE